MSNRNLSEQQFTGYTVITQHGEDRKVKRKKFDTAEEADSYAEEHHPLKDGSTVPSMDPKYADHRDYSRSHWFGKTNRYAVVLHPLSDD